jgi:hypothetical protein
MKNLYFGFFIFMMILLGKEAFSQRRSLFTPVDVHLQEVIDKSERYIQYESKYIRRINVKVLEPFGTTVDDTTDYHAHWPGKIGNFIHIKTRESIVYNLILLEEGKAFDALLARETERLIRQSGFVKDTRTLISVVEDDYVDVTFVVGDLWSINANLYSLTGPTSFKVYDRNFLGLSHTLENTFTYDFEKGGKLAIYGSYKMPFIENTFVSLTAFYSTSDINSLRGIKLNRGFFTAVTKWAGGIGISEHSSLYEKTNGLTGSDSINGNINNINNINIFESRYTEQDYWAGRSFQLTEGNSAQSRSTRFVAAARINNINYSLRKPERLDSLNLQQNKVFLAGSVGIYKRIYYIDRDIYRFGIIEDVVTGYALAFTGGYEFKAINPRPYAKVSAAFGNHFSGFGNISGGISFGTFARAGKMEEGAILYNISYFSDLFRIGRWGFRQFVNNQSFYGINRFEKDLVTLNEETDLFGFKSPLATGTKKISLNFRSVFYAPVALLGFRFAPVVLWGFGMLGNEQENLFKGSVFQSYGLGLLIRNESLAFTTFQFSIAFYPILPGLEGLNYRLNPTGAYDLNFQDFTVGRPETVPVR